MKDENEEVLLEQFAKKQDKLFVTKGANAVIYTRVSTKEQAETNMSLETQKKYCEQFASKQGYNVISYFGGTYESAKTDERNEFKRMLAFVKRSREKISYIIVYSVDRFSRSGANAIYIASELKTVGISIVSVTQPADTSTSSGSLQQNIQFIFSQYDNDLRKEKCVSGMREKLLKGYWLTVAPLGYDRVSRNNEHSIVINDKGKLIRKAFYWKAEAGLSNQEILEKLKSMNLKMRKQQLSKIFRNPFYCGMISHNLLEGKMVEGRHEAIISKEIFLRANGMLQKNHQKYKHDNEQETLPLKRFVKCGECGTSFTGYLVKKKGIYYYKCNKIGCKCNKNANEMHKRFKDFMAKYSLSPDLIELYQDGLYDVFYELNKENVDNQKLVEKQLKEVNEKIDLIEERYVLREISKEMYDKFSGKFKEEKREILKQLQQMDFSLSNIENYISFSVELAAKLQEMWELSDIRTKEKIQYLLFPEGIYYERKNSFYRTNRTNVVFELIRSITEKINKTKKGQTSTSADLSLSVPKKGGTTVLFFTSCQPEYSIFLLSFCENNVGCF